MAATIHPHRTHVPGTHVRGTHVRRTHVGSAHVRPAQIRSGHLRMASTATAPSVPVDAELQPRVVLRPIDGGQSGASKRRRRMYWRRRVFAMLLVVTVVVLAWSAAAGAKAFFADPAPDLPSAMPTAVAVAPLTSTSYVVQPGDTLWSIARRVAPERDPRPVVDELSHRLRGAPLQPGQRIDLEGLAS